MRGEEGGKGVGGKGRRKERRAERREVWGRERREVRRGSNQMTMTSL